MPVSEKKVHIKNGGLRIHTSNKKGVIIIKKIITGKIICFVNDAVLSTLHWEFSWIQDFTCLSLLQ